jgi:hypothetical protein
MCLGGIARDDQLYRKERVPSSKFQDQSFGKIILSILIPSVWISFEKYLRSKLIFWNRDHKYLA